MKPRLLFYLKYIVFWLGIQVLFRIIFLIVYSKFTRELNILDILLIFVHGFRLDLSLTGYILILPTFLLFVLSPFANKLLIRLMSYYTSLILVCSILLLVSNLIIYNFWNFPIDITIFDYLDTPGEMLASLNTWYLLILLTICATIIILLRLVYIRWINTHLKGPESSWKPAVVFFFMLPLLLIPIRGSFGVVPMNTGIVYFHHNIFANHAAINPLWNLVYSISEKDRLSPHLDLLSEEEARNTTDSLLEYHRSSPGFFSVSNPNIVIIILESFSNSIIEELGGKPGITPEFSKFIRDGIFFRNFYASGTMSDKGMGAIISGYPALPKTCILRYEHKSQSLPFLSISLADRNYKSMFVYGGDVNFAHFRAYFMNGRFDRIISEQDFSRDIKRSKWGVPDEFVLNRLFEESEQAEQPFFHVCFTLSSHDPYDVPMIPVFEGSGTDVKFYNSIFYTDKHLGIFFSRARETDWWDKTIFILLADHGTRMGNVNEFDRGRFHIPMVWLGGAISGKGLVIDKFGSQTDIARTLLAQLGIPSDNYIFSKNMLSQETMSFATYTFHDGFGWVNDSAYLVYHFPKQEYIITEGPAVVTAEKTGLAFMQMVFNDFNHR